MKETIAFVEEGKETSCLHQRGWFISSQLLDRWSGGLFGNIGYHNPQDPAIYAEEKDTGYPEPWRKSRLSEELE